MPPQPDLNALLAASIAQHKALADQITAHLDAKQIQQDRDRVYPMDSGGLVADMMVRNRPTLLKTVVCYNSSGATVYLQVHDKVCPAMPGESPKLILPIPSDSAEAFDFADGVICGNGLYLCASTTSSTKTLATAVVTLHATFAYA